MPRTLGKHTNHFGLFIRRRRRELSLTQREVAAALKVSAPEFVGMIEAGIRKPNFERLPALAEVLKVSTLEMIQLAFADVYPSLVGYLTSEQTAQTAKANRMGQKLYALAPSIRQPIIKMIDKFYAERSVETKERVA
jgi:transcriptional regulator with XRE-family HTH domain